MTYEYFHRETVLKKIAFYNNDVMEYYAKEWDHGDCPNLFDNQKNSEDFQEYGEIETNFIKQFFSIKA